MHEIVSDLRRDHDFVPLFLKCLGDQLLAQSVSISISRVEQRDAEIECLMHQRNRFAFGEISPPTRGNCPEPKPDLANRQVGVLVSAESHMGNNIKFRRTHASNRESYCAFVIPSEVENLL